MIMGDLQSGGFHGFVSRVSECISVLPTFGLQNTINMDLAPHDIVQRLVEDKEINFAWYLFDPACLDIQAFRDPNDLFAICANLQLTPVIQLATDRYISFHFHFDDPQIAAFLNPDHMLRQGFRAQHAGTKMEGLAKVINFDGGKAYIGIQNHPKNQEIFGNPEQALAEIAEIIQNGLNKFGQRHLELGLKILTHTKDCKVFMDQDYPEAMKQYELSKAHDTIGSYIQTHGISGFQTAETNSNNLCGNTHHRVMTPVNYVAIRLTGMQSPSPEAVQSFCDAVALALFHNGITGLNVDTSAMLSVGRPRGIATTPEPLKIFLTDSGDICIPCYSIPWPQCDYTPAADTIRAFTKIMEDNGLGCDHGTRPTGTSHPDILS
jgi:hypothetical protein